MNIPDFTDWEADEYNTYSNDEMIVNTANLLHLKPVYDRCQFSLVTETRYNLPYDFITEKTTQCFLALHPALYVSNKHHVNILRDKGFDVFDDIFDHGYDALPDDKRIDYLLDANVDLLNNGIPDYNDLEERLLKNRRHYLENFI